MKKILLHVCLFLVISFLIAGCSQSSENATDHINKQANFSVYFFYNPGCPWCRMVKPYIQLLKNESKNQTNELRIIMCNTGQFKNCTERAISIAKKIKLHGIPTAVVVNETNGSIEKVLFGADKVAELGELLRMHGYNVTAHYVVGGLNYTVKDCVNCHAKKGLKPPSTYSCTSCCHET
jgi:thiol-disulfide isomerase/thioredoxin